MWCVLIYIICISLLAIDSGILASSSSSSSISSWHHQHQSCTKNISTSSGISSGLYRGSSFAISSRRSSAFIQPSSCFATHNQSITSRRTTSIITATLFPIWKQRRSNTIESILNRVGRVEVKSAIPYIDTLSSTAEADLDMTADNLLQSASAAVDGLSKLNEGKDDTTVDTSNIDNNANSDESILLDDAQEDGDEDMEEAKEEKSILIHTYNSNLLLANADNTNTNTATTATSKTNVNNNNNQNLSLVGVGMSQRQFAAWVQYYITHMSEDGEVIPADQSSPQSSSATAAAAAQGILSRQPQLQQTIDKHAQQTILQQQHLQRTANSQTLDNLLQSNQITTESVEYESKVWEEEYIPIIREYWRNGKLMCEHTNILNGRRRPSVDEKSSKDDGKSGQGKLTKEQLQSKKEEETRQYKTEQFRDTLNSYAERLTSIVEDELSDVDFHPSEVVDSSDQEKRLPFNFGQIVDLPKRTTAHQTTQPHHHQQHQKLPQWQTANGLKGWIEEQYGIDNTRQLMADVLLLKSEKEQLQTFQTFLDWFRNNFPYFHDQCNSCGAPCKDDPMPHKSGDTAEKDARAEGSNNNIEEQQTNGVVVDQQEDEDEDDFSFLGYVYPTPSEKLGNASRTELYQCRTCSSYTRFPRYNKALWVTSTQRGRCGEYSMLLYRMLRVLGYENVRWVVDWADHVWAEVWLGDSSDNTEGSNSGGGRWVHLDPCEAAVDNPLLYESWGKNQTYIVAFHDPFYNTTSSSELIEGDRIPVTTASRIPEQNDTYRFQPVEDVTRHYTSDEAHVIEERRGILDKSVAEAIDEVSKNMVHLLDSLRTKQ